MTCDEVFNELSRANPGLKETPDPSVGEDLRQHLEGCESCAHIAQLFRPAVELISADTQTVPIRSSHSMWQSIRESAELANREAARLDSRGLYSRSQSTGRSRWSKTFQVVGLLLIGLGIGAFVNSEMTAGGLAKGTGDCNHLMMTIAEAGDICPTCEQPCLMTARQMTALCMACHVTPDISRSMELSPFHLADH